MYELTDSDRERIAAGIDKLKDAHPEIKIGLISLSGAHLYGTLSESSDYDLRGYYILPPEHYLGIKDPNETIEFGSHGSRDVEFQLHEIRKFVSLLNKPNMNFIECMYSPHVIESDEELRKRVKTFAERSISKATFQHVQGMTIHTKKHAGKEAYRRPKRNLYIFRELLRGIVLFETRNFVSDVSDLASIVDDADVIDHVRMLLDLKTKGKVMSIMDAKVSKDLIARLELRMSSVKDFGLLRPKPEDLTREADRLVRSIRLKMLETSSGI